MFELHYSVDLNKLSDDDDDDDNSNSSITEDRRHNVLLPASTLG